MIRCAVVGASGYTGAELVRLLVEHPQVELSRLCAAGSVGQRWEDLYPARRHLVRARLEPFCPDALAGDDVVFLALPHGESATAAAQLHQRVRHVIDLSGDLRLPTAEDYHRWYGKEHPAPELLGRAAYGLPELFGQELEGAPLVACAGCYATAAQIAAAPAMAALGATAEVGITAVSGTSGAGRKASTDLSFSEVFGDVRPYRVGRHQHAPEIARGLSRFCGRSVRVTFVPHLAPLERGIAATVILENKTSFRHDDLLAAYNQAYSERPFVRVLDPAQRFPAVRDVVGTNFCDLAPVVDEAGGTVVVVAVIDNLLKGAAGQAVQVLNRVLGWPETTGLLPELWEATA